MRRMPDDQPIALYDPTPDERSMATLAQALQMLGFIAPLIIWIIRRDSRFVSFHALQALFWQIAFMACWLVAMAVFMTAIFWTIATAPPQRSASGSCDVQQTTPSQPGSSAPAGTPAAAPQASGDCGHGSSQPLNQNEPFPKALIFFPLLWILFFGLWMVSLVLTIVYAIKASRGEWAGYPLIGNIIRRALHLPRPA
jgi:uncharacterized Tic20 family protein